MSRPNLLRRALVEALAAFILVFIGCGAVMTDALRPGSLGPAGTAAVFGLVVVGLVYATGHLSGAHVNPAVTLAFVVTRHFPAREATAYIAAQVSGAIAAAGLLALVWGTGPADLGAAAPTTGPAAALVYETVLTAVLMFVIVSVATDTRGRGGAAIAIGTTVAFCALVGGPITGASLNPARSFGPALVSGSWTDFWIYVVGPVTGALLGATGYEVLRAPLIRRPCSRHRRDRETQPVPHLSPPLILPPFTRETALEKVKRAEAAWNSRDPDRVVLAYTEDSEWRNRAEFFAGRTAIHAFLTRKWAHELDYVLRKDLWAFADDRISVAFVYESRDRAGQWWRSYGNEQWEFEPEGGLMRRRQASINDVAIDRADRVLGE